MRRTNVQFLVSSVPCCRFGIGGGAGISSESHLPGPQSCGAAERPGRRFGPVWTFRRLSSLDV
jgi:hypothetical protein